MQYLFSFSDMRAYRGKSFFVTLLQSQISENQENQEAFGMR